MNSIIAGTGRRYTQQARSKEEKNQEVAGEYRQWRQRHGDSAIIPATSQRPEWTC
jgi:hypothetical protein